MLKKMIVTLAAWLAFGIGVPAGAVVHLDTSEVVAATAEAAAQLPPTYDFTLTAAGNYVVTLKDISLDSGLPQSLQSLQVLVTRDLQAVARLSIEYPAQPSVTPPAKTQTFAGTPGTYRVHVLGAIAANGAGGLFSVDVAPSAGGAAVFAVADAIATQNAPPSEQSLLQTEFTVSTAGSYRVLALDRGFPSALLNRNVLLVKRSPQTQVEFNTSGAFSPSDVGTFNAQVGDTYELIVVATASPGSAGLYGAAVRGGPSDTVIYRSENGVGALPPARALTIPTAATYSLALTDLQFPVPLTAFSAAIVQNDAFVGSVAGATPGNISLSAGSAQLFVYSTTATTGALSAVLSSGGQVAYGDVHITDASPDATTPAIYSFSPSEPVSRGNYALSLNDLRFPTELPSLRALAIQEGLPVGQLNAAGNTVVSLEAGKVRVLVAATPPPVSGTLPGNGAFALALKAANDAIVFESTQGVGGLFNAKVVDLPAAGRYDIELKDFEFPSRLRISWLAVTHGTELVGQVIGSSPIQNLQLEGGVHVLNFIGQPAANTNYGAFGLKVSDSTPAPVVTLSASPTSVTAGQSSTLTWSATNATSCTASNGWSGSKTVSGTQSTGALSTSSNTTYALECVGPGGRSSASVTVSVTVPTPGKSGGGGGHLDPLLLVALATVLTLATVRRQRGVMK
ncbi:hypothetical protein ACFPN2_02720 [Steroidobacter flavus]|uniref:Ig-like domain-containing protein n=1 Tax=Steroidobacter flavus TaxID=1842136 RepID=A0ABV8SK31_9GAMM